MIERRFTYDYELNGKIYKIDFSSPLGAGGGVYYLVVDNYYQGQFVRRPWGIHPYIENGTMLTSDDIGALVDMANEWESQV